MRKLTLLLAASLIAGAAHADTGNPNETRLVIQLIGQEVVKNGDDVDFKEIRLSSLNGALAKARAKNGLSASAYPNFPATLTLGSTDGVQWTKLVKYVEKVAKLLNRKISVVDPESDAPDLSSFRISCYEGDVRYIKKTIEDLRVRETKPGSGKYIGVFGSYFEIRFAKILKGDVLMLRSDYGQQGDGTERVYTYFAPCAATAEAE
jgi:hypothetical protein